MIVVLLDSRESVLKEMVYISGVRRLLVRLNQDEPLVSPNSDVKVPHIINLFTFEPLYQELKNQNYLRLFKKLGRFLLILV